MMVPQIFTFPLSTRFIYPGIYPGNVPYPVEFRDVLEKLKARFQKICGEPKKVTLVFDKRNNSLENINLLNFKIVCSLKFSQCKTLLEIPKSRSE